MIFVKIGNKTKKLIAINLKEDIFLNIHHVIAHELDKKIDDKNAKKIINPKGEFDKNSSILQRFIASTDKSYKRRPKALGNFDPNTNAYPLQILLNNYLSLENKDSKSFIELTEKAMDYLVNAATNIIKATGGIVVFMHYDDSFMILLLSKKTVFNINNFVLEDLEAMDIESLRVCRRLTFLRELTYEKETRIFT
ncbi:nucleoid-associated protein [Cellvibrio polysaccharolyticus]|uniref:nucleoid-associated protein n=1 Tax=Cellvibrio polysaccharolyticus TaxID=2082724 RepID=UPI0018830D6A|nr:nucleoid-associated protein [Cellvibrio polysaccharolyticus]